MAWIFGITEKRKAQLKIEEVLDQKLEELTKDCPIVYMKYLLNMRCRNREQFYQVSERNIFNQYDLIKDNIDSLNKLYELINLKIDLGENPCDFLNDL